MKFQSTIPEKKEHLDFDEETCTLLILPLDDKDIYINNLKQNYIVPIKSTLSTKKHEFLLTKATPHLTGYDMCAIADTTIPPNSCKAIPTGLCMAIPPGLYGRIESRSGLATKHNINVGA
eukprot:1682628-Ditylum_brightwellii.AAC.1